MKKQFIFLLLLSFQAVAYTQTKESDISYETDYLLEEFRLPGGSAGNNVNCIVEGPHGFLWFGTHAGLHRYDGYETITYSPVAGDTIGETTSLTFPYVENMYWDRFDKLWLTTYGGGLFRFDPEKETFKHFKADPDAPDALPHPQVMCASEDANGELWIGTEKGLCRFDRKTEKFQTYFADSTNAQSLRHDQIRNLYVDKQGTLWIGTGEVLWGRPTLGGISRYHPETNTFSNYGYWQGADDSSYLGAVMPMLEDSRGNFWVGTTNGLYKMDREEGTFEKMPFDPNAPHAPGEKELETSAVHAIYEDRSDGLWVGTIGAASYPSHLLRFDPKTQSTQHFPLQSAAWQICESSDGTIWIAGAGVGGRVWKVKPKALEYDLQRGSNIKAAFPTSKLYKDLNVHPSYWIYGPIEMTIDPATDFIWVQYVLSEYDLKFSKPGLPLLAKYDPKSEQCEFYALNGLTNKDRDPALPGNQFDAAGMAVDKYGKIWGSYANEHVGIYSFDPKTGAIQHFKNIPGDPNSLTSNYVVRMILDSRGEIWAANFRAGLNRLNPETGKITHYHFEFENDYPDDDFPIALMENLEGKILVGGEMAEGLDPFVAIIDPATDSIQDFPLPESIKNSSIIWMAQHPENRYLTAVLADKGLCDYFVAEQRFVSANSQLGNFPFDDIASILYDKNGNGWIARKSSGDFVFWPESVGGHIKHLFRNKSHFGTLSRRAVIGPNNGHLYFLNEEGWAEINPDELDVQTPADSSHAQLVDLYVLGEKQVPGKGGILTKPLWMLDDISLPNDAETFGFHFTDFNFRSSAPKYQYRLFPYERVWRETNLEPVANYYKIPSGKYRFQVKAMKENGQAGIQQTELKITILPPWWKSWWAFTLYGLLFLTGLYFFDRFERNRIIQRERQRILQRELAQAKEIEKAYSELKAAQAQLIQSEKLASLGELTAGIAHEIQNPLNFVNNFAELSVDLAEELNEEIDKDPIDKALIKELMGDLTQNQQKINHHGKRAASIVTGMLQHARTSTGTKEPTDLNALADEYLRLSYHGLRAKDSTFNAKMETDLDPSIGKLEVVPQDIGRVFLNLINNAFYATQQRRLGIGELGIGGLGDEYEPTVSVSSHMVPPLGGQGAGQVVFKIKDNGTGIPDHVKAKIFQPFFTTKPTGQGTGLGLSLAYDIVTKGHGGTLEVETIEGEGTEFIIQLPVKNNEK